MNKIRLSKPDFLTIFIVTHKDFTPYVSNKSIYKILVSSKSVLQPKYDLDIIETTENYELGKLSRAYSELNRYYWIYKNYRPLPKYIGFNHYRRNFIFYDNPPNLDKIFSSHDVILNMPHAHEGLIKGYNVGELYKSYHYNQSFDECLSIVKEYYSELNGNHS